MDDELKREFQQLQALAKPFRFRVTMTQDGEAILSGQRGQVELYAVDGTTLVAFTQKPGVLKELVGLDWVTRHQIGEAEGSVLFPSEKLWAMAEILKLRKKRPAPHPGISAKGLAGLRRFGHQAAVGARMPGQILQKVSGGIP